MMRREAAKEEEKAKEELPLVTTTEKLEKLEAGEFSQLVVALLQKLADARQCREPRESGAERR